MTKIKNAIIWVLSTILAFLLGLVTACTFIVAVLRDYRLERRIHYRPYKG